MADDPAKVKITAEISATLFETLKSLAEQRGVSANTILSQAISTENFISENEAAGSKLLIEKPNHTLTQVTRKKPSM
ncbi:hypothetical protein AUC70_00010 [Methyloceanibacter stevinii]|uniref:CopG family transcriptional regulator n=1 Tax=Methyloceanibacter stevinii TaxID=1774970 RepID=A0A1E3VV78_9HYPH|nr:hypothetical protein [Methyloceanibacter stevinii]ODR97458.1 hypothetical protein AUC70_00010 [Methyloceanibacter stevinii]